MHYDVLVKKIAGDTGLKSLVESIGGVPDHELLESLMMEFRQVAERYKCYGDYASEAKAVFDVSHTTDSAEGMPDVEVVATDRPLYVAPIRIELPQLGIVAAKPLHPHGMMPSTHTQVDVRKELEDVEKMIQEEIDRDWNTKSGNVAGRIIQLRNSQLLLKTRLAALEEGIEPREDASAPQYLVPSDRESIQELSDEDIYYLYGLMPLGAPEPRSSGLSALTSVDGANSVFCTTVNDMRVIVSRLDRETFTVAANGVLLLTKQEGMHIRLLHHRVVNQLRMDHTLIPFEVGVVLRGDSFVRALGALGEVRQLLEQEGAEVTWTVTMYVSDGTMAEAMGGKSASKKRPDTERRRRKFDIKFLEKLLQHQKGLAREAHNVLSICSSSADILMMIGLAGGTSDDWKPVLKASYTVIPEFRPHFFTAVERLTTQFASQGVLFEVEGRASKLSLPHTLQELSA